MLKRLSDWLYRTATARLAALSLIVFLAFSLVVLPGQAASARELGGGAGSPDTTFVYTPADLYRMAEAYGADGRAAFLKARWGFDVAWPLVYTSFLAMGASWLLGRALPAGDRRRLWNLLPVLAMALDVAENTGTSLVMLRYPAQTPVIDLLAPLFTTTKWLAVVGSIVLLLVALVAARMARTG